MQSSLRPVLRGEHKVVGSGKTVWEGSWCMRQEDLDNAALTAPFFYERTGPSPKQRASKSTQLEDGLYSGYFEIKSITGTSKFNEKNVLLEFSDRPGDDKVLDVSGSGANKIGKFHLRGSLDLASKVLTITREYVPKKKKTKTVRSQARVQRELDLWSTTTPNAGKNSSDRARPSQCSLSRNAVILLQKLLTILDSLVEADSDKWFAAPVDAQALGLLDYHDIIDRPMDLGTVRTKYHANEYMSPQEMRDDIELTFSNAIHYNPRGSPVYKKAVELQTLFREKFQNLVNEREASEISTPDAAQSFRRIGKRHSIPKIQYIGQGSEVDTSKSPRSPPGSVSPKRDRADALHPAKKRRKRSSNASSSAHSELARLKDQLQQMSESIAKLGQTMTTSPLPPALVDMDEQFAFGSASFDDLPFEPAPPNVQPAPVTDADDRPQKQVSFEFMRRLGRDIHLLPGPKLTRVVEIIQDCGFVLPVNNATGEVELDIDMLDYDTIQKLRKYVSRHLPSALAAAAAAADEN